MSQHDHLDELDDISLSDLLLEIEGFDDVPLDFSLDDILREENLLPPEEDEPSLEAELAMLQNALDASETAEEIELDEKVLAALEDVFSKIEAEKAEESKKAETDTTAEAEPINNVIAFSQEPETVEELLQEYRSKTKSFIAVQKSRLIALKAKNIFSKRQKKEPTEEEILEDKRHSRPPDLAPKVLSIAFGRGLPLFSFQSKVCSLFTIFLLIISIIAELPQDLLPAALSEGSVIPHLGLGLYALVFLLAYPLYVDGISGLLRFQPSPEFLCTIAALFTLIDGIALESGAIDRAYSLPLYAPAALVLSFGMWGSYWRKSEIHKQCRTAASTSSPDRMTAEPGQWNGKSVYRHRLGDDRDFGSQIQEPDGTQIHFYRTVPVLFLASLFLASFASIAQQQNSYFPWAMSATFIAVSTLNGCLCFSLPFKGLSQRLQNMGIALAGWRGILGAKSASSMLIDATDLFPTGTVKLVAYKIYSDDTPDDIFSMVASLLEAMDSSLFPEFKQHLILEGGHILPISNEILHEDGITATIDDLQVALGTKNFLAQHGVNIPDGAMLSTGIYLAIGTYFTAQFDLDYKLLSRTPQSLETLLENRITPVVMGLDFNLIPDTLRWLSPFNWQKVSFPQISQRKKLKDSPLPHTAVLLALSTYEGIAPFTTATVGAQRLYKAVKLCLFFHSLSAMIGLLLTAYLALFGAVTALSALHLSMFLLLWFVPTFFISGWVNQF